MTMDRVSAYLESHRGDFEEQLKALIRIPSISAQPDHDPDTRRAAAFIRDDLAAMGLEVRADRNQETPARLCRVAGCARQADDPDLRSLRCSAPRAARAVALAPVRADRAQRQPLRPRRHRRQGPDVHAPEGRRGMEEDRGQAAGQRQDLDRGRRGGRRRQPRGLCAREQEKAGLRFRGHLRQQPVRPRSAGDHLRPERAGLLRAARSGSQPRLALGDLWRRRRQSAQCAGHDPRQP